jgi:hypothetical protein
MVSGFISTSAGITEVVAVGDATGVGEAVATGVGVGVVDAEIIPPGTSIARLALTLAREGVGVAAGVAIGELVGVGEAIAVGVGVGDVALLITTLTISSLSPFVSPPRVNSNSAFPSVILNDSSYVFETSLISVSIIRILL